MDNTNKNINYILCMLSGAITAVSFIFPRCNFLVWFSIIPCFYVLLDSGVTQMRKSFFIMFIYGIGFYGVLFTWLWGLYPLDWLGFTNFQSILIVLVAWLGLSIFEALFPAILGAIFCKLKKNSNIGYIYISLLWVIMEWLQGIGPTGMSWSRLSNSQYNNSYIIQSASIFGSLFISLIIVLANAFIASYLHNKSKYIYIVGFFFIFIINFGYGYYRINNVKLPDSTIQISVIQPNINSAEKWDSGSLNNIFNTYSELTKMAKSNIADKLDIVVWAETSLPITLLENKDFLNRCYELADYVDSTILIGAFEEVEGKTYNAMFEISPFDNTMEIHHKQNLVPFGEYMPFRGLLDKIAPFISNINAGSGDISSDKESVVMNTPSAIIGNLICFDSIFSEVARKHVINGADIIAVETNDSWFNGTPALHQHLSQSVMRAVENKRYVLRSANTGISAVISPIGQILSVLEPETKGYINYKVSSIKEHTLYTKLGDIIVFVSIFLIIIIIMLRIIFEIIINPILKKLKFFWRMFLK